MKKISILLAMLALMMFSALPVAGAYENTSEQYIYDSQNAYVDINGNDNSVAIDQSISQSAFSPYYYDYCYPVWIWDYWWGWLLVCY